MKKKEDDARKEKEAEELERKKRENPTGAGAPLGHEAGQFAQLLTVLN